MSNEQTVRPWWKLGFAGWCGIAVLVLINVVVFTDWIAMDRRTFARIVYSCDPHRWPVWISCLLWGAVFWTLAGLPQWPEVVRRFRWIMFSLIMAAAAITIFFQYDIYTVAVRRRIYDRVYLRYFVAPYANYFVDGQTHWTMLIAPLTGATALGSFSITVTCST